MKIAIHNSKISYSIEWIKYCNEKLIPYKIVNCYSTDIVDTLRDCDALMWHFHHENPKDMLFAKQLLTAVEASGKIVYPDCKSSWHFDDKIGQKYLLEAFNLPLIPSFVFYSKNEALEWLRKTEFPLVMKLRNGSAGHNVRLVRSFRNAKLLTKIAFGRGFRQVNPFTVFNDQWSKYRKAKVEFRDILKALAHFVYPYQIEKSKSREKGYIYFQKFIPNCSYDIRIQIVSGNAWAMLRKVRIRDFRASGSGDLIYNKALIPEYVLNTSYKIYHDLEMQTIAIDFLITSGIPLITEICYAFGVDDEELEEGYWDKNCSWHPGRFNPYGWMVDEVIGKILHC